MADAVETMAWTNEVPWHGLGHKVDGNLSPKQMLKAAKLDWSVSLRSLRAGDSHNALVHNTEVKEFFALVRDSDETVFDVVGSRWKPTQNEEAFEFFNEFVHAGGATMETAGSLHGGRMVWGLANMQRAFKLKGGDEVKGYLLMALPHEQGKSIRAMLTMVRVVCNNTLTQALRDGVGDGFRMSHRRVFDALQQETAKRTLGIAREDFDVQKEIAEKLAGTTLVREDALKLLAELIEPSLLRSEVGLEELLASNKVPKDYRLCALSLDKAPGQQLSSATGTLWGVVNAVTYAADHLFGKMPDRRLSKAWFGTAAKLKSDAVRLALKKAGK